MPEMLTFPPAVVLGLWLNAAYSGSVSPTDATNAIETITDQVDFSAGDQWPNSGSYSLLELVKKVASADTPVAVALPVDGDPAGIPSHILAKVDRTMGVIAINRNLLLLHETDGKWVLADVPNTVIHHDLSQTRRSLLDHISSTSAQLAASDLVGDETSIIGALNAFRTLDFPPHLSKRSTDALELAAKIMIVAAGAVSNSAALHSPSADRARMQNLELLITESRSVLQSVVTS